MTLIQFSNIRSQFYRPLSSAGTGIIALKQVKRGSFPLLSPSGQSWCDWAERHHMDFVLDEGVEGEMSPSSWKSQ